MTIKIEIKTLFVAEDSFDNKTNFNRIDIYYNLHVYKLLVNLYTVM